MTSEQLQATRALRWRQNADPILTQEDAQGWLQQTGLCLFLPRRPQLPAPAPSFVEACLGEVNPTPPRTAVENATQFVARLIDVNAAIPLNLLGTPADHPDFLVSPDTLPFVYALRGDRDWKHAPGSPGSNRVSPLVAEVWKLLEAKAPLNAIEIKDSLGREVTEAAVLRALHELWGSLRVVPRYQTDGRPSLWEPLQLRHKQALKAAINMSQVTALSALAAGYFLSAVAATEEQAEIFLSPVSSRSKVREVVRGLTATRQLAMISMERESLLFVEGSLPEFEEAPALLVPAPSTADSAQRPLLTGPRPRSSGAPVRRDRTGEGPKRDWKRGPVDAQPLEKDSSTPRESAAKVRPGTFQPGAGARRERPPARPPWKDKGKPGFAQSAAARDPKARWPREKEKYPPKATSGEPQPEEGMQASPKPGRAKEFGSFRPALRAGGAQSPRGDFKDFAPRRKSATGRFEPRRPVSGFGARSAAGSERSRPERRETSPGSPKFGRTKGSGGFRSPQRREGDSPRPRGDFKDFKPRRESETGRFEPRRPSTRFGGRSEAGRGPERREGGGFKGKGQPFKGKGTFGKGTFNDSPRQIGPPKTEDRGPRKFGPRREGSDDFPQRRAERPSGRFGDQNPQEERPVRPFAPRKASSQGGESRKPYSKARKPFAGDRQGGETDTRPARTRSLADKPFGGSGRKSGPGARKGSKPGARSGAPGFARGSRPSSRPPRRPADGEKRRTE